MHLILVVFIASISQILCFTTGFNSVVRKTRRKSFQLHVIKRNQFGNDEVTGESEDLRIYNELLAKHQEHNMDAPFPVDLNDIPEIDDIDIGDQPGFFKSGFVSIVGNPNVGKSTLINSLLKEKLSIVTPKPQTTRQCILGILSDKQYQLIFCDTPGMVKDPSYKLQENMRDTVMLSTVNHRINS